MKYTSLLIAGAMALSFSMVASAKSYGIVLSSRTQAGEMVLPAGQYNVKVEGSNAVFTLAETHKQYSAPVKVETAQQKHAQTAVETVNQNGTDRIEAIELGGSNTTLEFRN